MKPTIDGEPSYEQIVHGLHDNTQPYWQSWDTRRYAYWSVFAGAFGHTFGDNAIMQFFRKDLEKEGAFGVWQDWREALHNIGGMQMGHLKHLMESVDYQNGCAAQNLVTEGDGEAYRGSPCLQERTISSVMIIRDIRLHWIWNLTREHLIHTGWIP